MKNKTELIEAMLKSTKVVMFEEMKSYEPECLHGPMFAYAAIASYHIYHEKYSENIQHNTIFYANVCFLAIKRLSDA